MSLTPSCFILLTIFAMRTVPDSGTLLMRLAAIGTGMTRVCNNSLCIRVSVEGVWHLFREASSVLTVRSPCLYTWPPISLPACS